MFFIVIRHLIHYRISTITLEVYNLDIRNFFHAPLLWQLTLPQVYKMSGSELSLWRNTVISHQNRVLEKDIYNSIFLKKIKGNRLPASNRLRKELVFSNRWIDRLISGFTLEHLSLMEYHRWDQQGRMAGRCVMDTHLLHKLQQPVALRPPSAST